MPTVNEHTKACYSHWGEDMVLAHVFEGSDKGRYLDVGCYHPSLASNTKLLHDKGWSGVNVDPNAFMIEQFKLARPGDVNLNIAVGAERGRMLFYKFHDWASSNTLRKEFAENISKQQNVPITSRTEVEIVPLVEIMDTYFCDGGPDFLNIDVEELDAEVLGSNDWKRFRPKVVAVEDFGFRFKAPSASKLYALLVESGYQMFSRTIYTSFFIESGFNAATHQFA
jgi:FkbM family methyltransferase